MASNMECFWLVEASYLLQTNDSAGNQQTNLPTGMVFVKSQLFSACFKARRCEF